MIIIDKEQLTLDEKNFNTKLGKALKNLRTIRKKTQTQVAKQIGVTFQQIQKYEKGANAISEFKARRICTYLGKDYNLLQEEFNVCASSR